MLDQILRTVVVYEKERLMLGLSSPLDRLKARSLKGTIIGEQIHTRTPYQLLSGVSKRQAVGARR